MMTRALFGGALALALAGCSSVDDGSKAGELARVIKGMQTPAVALELTPQLVASSAYPLAEMRTNTRRSVAMRSLDQGGIATFITQDAGSFAVRDGVLIGARGLHGDVNAATGPSLAQIASAKDQYQRVYEILDGETLLKRHSFTCQLAPAGNDSISIAGKVFDTKIVSEICEQGDQRFENRYWLDQSGKIRQTSQWIGSYVDFLRLQFA